MPSRNASRSPLMPPSSVGGMAGATGSGSGSAARVWPGCSAGRSARCCFWQSAVLTVYSPSLDGLFIWDDVLLVSRKNLLIRSPLLCLEAFRHTLFDNESNSYRPTQIPDLHRRLLGCGG